MYMKKIYNGNGQKSGIYKITCIKNGKYYIGSAYNFSKRASAHLYRLRLNNHHCKHFQNCFNKHGENIFIFEILEITSKEKLTEAEQLYLNEHFNDEKCMNSHPVVNERFADNVDKETLKKIYSRKKSKEEREKISKARMGKYGVYKDQGYSKPTNQILKLIREDKDIPEDQYIDQIVAKELRDAYNRWTKPTKRKNPKLWEQQGKRKKKIKSLLLSRDLWYDARDDSWMRKSKKDQKTALKNLKTYRKTDANAKTYNGKLLSPDGKIYGPITNLAKFCRKHKLWATHLALVINGKQKQHKGWIKISEITKTVSNVLAKDDKQ